MIHHSSLLFRLFISRFLIIVPLTVESRVINRTWIAPTPLFLAKFLTNCTRSLLRWMAIGFTRPKFLLCQEYRRTFRITLTRTHFEAINDLSETAVLWWERRTVWCIVANFKVHVRYRRVWPLYFCKICAPFVIRSIYAMVLSRKVCLARVHTKTSRLTEGVIGCALVFPCVHPLLICGFVHANNLQR